MHSNTATTMRLQIVLVILWLAKVQCDQTRSRGSDLHQKYALKEEFCWPQLDFKFPNASARHVALKTGSYIPKNNNIWSMGVWRHKIFVSVFRFGRGVASSLNYFSMKSSTKSPVLIPYPSFDANYVNEDPKRKTLTLPSNSSIICAGYFRIDKCDRIWILDVGYVAYFGQVRVLATPALIIFHLPTNTLLRRYIIPAKFINPNSFFNNLDIDIDGNRCDEAYAYMVDLFRTIVVYSLKKNHSWRLVHNLFGSNPLLGNFFYKGVNFQWNFGILGITVGSQQHDGSKRVYLSPLASTNSYYISNKVLQNERYIALNKYYCDVHLLGDRGTNGQLFKWAYDGENNVLFDTQFNRGRIGCWNIANPYKNSSFAIVYENKQIFVANDIVIDHNRNLWMLSNNLPIFLYGSWNVSDTNIRIFKGNVDDVILGTVCEHKLPKIKSRH